MKNPMNLFWGLVLIGIGVLLLGSELNWWMVNLEKIVVYLLPLILIITGVRFVIDNDYLFIIIAILVIVLFGCLIVNKPAIFHLKDLNNFVHLGVTKLRML